MSYVILVPLLPLLAALVIGVAGRSLRERSAKVGGAAVVAAFLGALVTLVAVSSNGPISVRFYEPASGTSLGFPVGFYIDRLSAVMMVLISGVSTIIYLFSMRYMQQERGYSRFLALLAFTTFVLLCMVSSANLLMLFIFWQLLTWLLYLLSHHYAHPATMEGAFKTYTLLRVGDVAFLSGIVLAYGLSQTTLHLVFAIGALTALLGAGMMLTQNDIKKTLGYSTIGQMGYMIMECGLGAFALAIFHLIAHGLFKATIFLNCGHVIHAARQEPRLPPKDETVEQTDFSLLTWLTGFITTLILPLIILLAAHGVLSLPLRNSQGVVIFLFFSWVTSSQAILTLYRLRAVASRKVAALMLLTLLLVVSTYLLAVQAFTYFLYPAPGEVAAYFQAAALPRWLFDVMVGATALAVILGWVFIYAKGHGRSLRMPDWVNGVQTRFYLFFMNRLYVDALALRLGRGFTRVAHWLDTSRLFPYVAGLIALGLVLPAAVWTWELSAANITLFFVAALMIPLFPLHGVYVAALTRLPGYLPMCLAILLPTVGLYGLMGLLPEMPAEFLKGVSVLALFGALYGSLKALVQFRVSHLLAYAGLAFFSILWWYLAVTGTSTPQAAVYTCAVALVIGGLFLAWHRVQVRYGDLDLNQIGGLARPMPRFAILLSLLVMAAVGLPPFGLFSGYMAILLHPSIVISWDLMVILLTWLARSEEHTSELQSRLHLVCRLLLEKKKTHTEIHAY